MSVHAAHQAVVDLPAHAKDRDKACENWERYTRARDAGHLEYVELADKCDRFYVGDQWDPNDKAKLDAEGRPSLTINMILSTINVVLGEQSVRRADVRFMPRRDASAEVAEVLNKVYMQVADNNQLDWKESMVFADGIIQDRGYFEVRMNFDDHLQGEIEINALDPKDVILDPDAKNYDPKTWNEVIVTRWMSIDDIELTYGKDKADSIRVVAGNGDAFGYDSVEYRRTTFGSDDMPRDNIPSDPTSDRDIRRVRVVDRQYYKNHHAMHFVDPETGDMRMVPDSWDKQRVAEFSQRMGMLTMKKLIRRVRWTVSVDKVLLHDDWSPYKTFTVIPFFPYFRRGRPFGMVRNLISPQEMLNKSSSQELHIINTTANSGWLIEAGSIINMSMDEIKEHGAESGLVIEYAKGATPPVKITSNHVPTGLDRVSMKSAINIKEISGVTEALRGSEGNEVSGVAIQERRATGQVQIQVPMDNLGRTRYYLAQKVLELLQTFYTEPRMFQVVDYADPHQQMQPVEINKPTPTGEVLNNITLGEYDIVIGQQPSRDTYNDTQFAQAIGLRSAGVMIPDDAVVEYSQLDRKKELAERIRRITGTGEPSEEQIEFQNQMQQLQMATLQAELAKLEAESMLKQAQAAKAAADAKSTLTDGDDLQLELKKLNDTIALKREELASRERIALMSAQSRINERKLDARTRLATSVLRNDTKTGNATKKGA